MRIVFGTDVFYPYIYSGSEVYLLNMARALAKIGHDIRVICCKTTPVHLKRNFNILKGYEIVEEIKILRASSPHEFGSTLSSIPSILQMKRILSLMIDKNDIDVCIPARYRAYIPFYQAARKKVPCIAIWHHISSRGKIYGLEGWLKDYEGGKIRAPLGWGLENLTLKLPYDGMITVSESSKDILSKYTKGRIDIIPDGVDLNKIDNIKSRDKVNQAIYIGALTKSKSVMHAIKAVVQAKEKIKNLKLVIVSFGGPQEDVVKNAVSRHEFIKYYKGVSDEEKFKLLKESKVLIHPSTKEGFGLVLIEALACGTPFISYDIPAMREMAKNTGGGVVVPINEVNYLTEKICEFMLDSSSISEFAKKGRSYVEKNYTWDAVSKKMDAVIREIVSEFRGGQI